METLNRRGRVCLLQDQTNLVENPPPAQLLEKLHLQGIFHQVRGQLTDGEAEPLLKSDRPENARRILHEAEIVEDPDDLLLDVFLSCEKVDQNAEFDGIQLNRQGVDGKIPSKQVQLDGVRPGRVSGLRRKVDLLRHTVREHLDV